MLENGDLIFVKDLSDMGQAIQASTGTIVMQQSFWTVSSTMLVGKQVLFVKNQQNFFEPTHLYDLYVYPELEVTW